MIDLPVLTPETPANTTVRPRKPDWLRVKLPVGKEYAKVREIVDTHKLHTICVKNVMEFFSMEVNFF
jgi:lipoic acid synthetase